MLRSLPRFFSKNTFALLAALVTTLVTTLLTLWFPHQTHAQERFVQPIASDLPGRTVWGFATSGTVSAPQTFAATDNGLYRRTGSGNNGTGAWTALTVDAKLKNASASVFAVKVRTVSGRSTVLAGTANGVYRSTDGGTSWANVETTSATQRGVLVGKTVFDLELVGSTFFAATEKGVYRSADDGKTWTLVNVDKTADNNQVRGITVFGNVVVVNLWSEGLWRSVNGGQTWAKMTIAGESALCRAVYAQQATNGTVWLVGSVAGNIWRSGDNGGTWKKVYSGQTAARSATMAMGADAFTGGWVGNSYVRSIGLFAVVPGGIAYSVNNGQHWELTRIPTSKALSITLFDNTLFVGNDNGGDSRSLSSSSINKSSSSAEILGNGENGSDSYDAASCTEPVTNRVNCDGSGGGGGNGGTSGGGGVIPTPQLVSLSPAQFPSSGSQALTLVGNNFVGNLTVLLSLDGIAYNQPAGFNGVPHQHK